MLARLSRNTARLLELQFEGLDESQSITEDEETLSLDIDAQAFRALVVPLPDLAWRNFARMCGQNIAPVYRSIQNMLANDVDHLTKLLLELEPLSKEDLYEGNEIDENAKASLCACCTGGNLTCGSNDLPLGYNMPPERPARKRRRSMSPQFDRPLVIPSIHPSIPTIIVTPCSSQPREISCRVPCQDGRFGNRLTVPLHIASNQFFPPQQLPLQPLPQMDRWQYLHGHWWAILPNLEDQMKKGMFSRPLVVRKRPCRLPCPRVTV